MTTIFGPLLTPLSDCKITAMVQSTVLSLGGHQFSTHIIAPNEIDCHEIEIDEIILLLYSSLILNVKLASE